MRLIALHSKKVTAEAAKRVLASYGGTIVDHFPQIRALVVDFDHNPRPALSGHQAFDSIEEERNESAVALSLNDTYYSSQWQFQACRLDQNGVWSATGGQGVKIAVIDRGVNTAHSDLAGMNYSAWNPALQSTDISPIGSHGNGTLSMIAATPNNSNGIAGVAPGAEFLLIKMNSLTTAEQIASILYAVDQGADIISMSISVSPHPAMQAAVAYARRAGVVCVFASSNVVNSETSDGIGTKDCIMVSGINKSDYSRYFSYGDWLDIMAPATNLYVHNKTGTIPTGGNSYAAPIVAGICALVKQRRPDLGYADIRAIVLQSANWAAIPGNTPGWNKYNGWGLVDAQAALALADTWVSIGWRSPSVTIVSPAPGATVTTGQVTNITVASQDDIAIQTIKIFVDDVEVHSANASVTTFSWTPATNGRFKIRAVGYDDLGQDAPSTEIYVTAVGAYRVSGAEAAKLLENLTKSQDFEVRARYVNSSGEGPWSDWTTFSTGAVAPETAPGGLIVERAGRGYQIYFSPADNNSTQEYKFGESGTWAEASNPLVLTTEKGGGTLYLRGVNATGESVYATTALEFSNLFYVASDVSSGYAVRTSVQPTANSFYIIRGEVQKEASVGYDVMVSAQSDVSSSYFIKELVQNEASDNYSVRASVSKDISSTYNVRANVQNDVSSTHDVRSFVQKDVLDDYFVSSSVQSDKASTYSVRTPVSQVAEANYTVFNSVQNNVASTYSVRQEVKKDTVSSYTVDAAVGVVSNETSSEYLVRSSVAEDRLSSFNVRSTVFDEKAGTYGVLGTVLEDSTSAFLVRESTGTEVSDEYGVLSAVFEDVIGPFNVLGVVSSSVTSSYEVVSASTVATSVSGSYAIRDSVLSSNESTYFVRDVIAASSEGSYVVREVVSQDNADSFIVRSVISQTAEDDYFVVSVVTKDTSSSYEVLSDKTPVGNSVTSGYIIFNSVSGDVVSYYNIFGGFAVVKRYNVTLKKGNVFHITLQ